MAWMLFVGLKGCSPLLVAVGRTEERQFHDDAATVGLGDELLQPRQVFGRETVEVELVPAARIARLFAARPWGRNLPGAGASVLRSIPNAPDGST